MSSYRGLEVTLLRLQLEMAGIRAENENNYCEHCLELRRTLVKTLGEKRALLLRLQKEQGRIRKLLKEAEKGKKKDGEV